MDQSTKTVSGEAGRAAAWLSEGFETLIRQVGARRASEPDAVDYDVVIVGSGYGGAVALSRLAGYATDGRPLRICLLERGKEYLPGMFPTGFADLAGHVRFDSSGNPRSRGVDDGLFDVKVGPDVHALVANGLGGGSLINAGVMAWPVDSVFATAAWPREIRAEIETLRLRSEELKIELGARKAPEQLAKVQAMRRLGGQHGANPLDICVARSDGPNQQGVEMFGCIDCGDCFTGCNHRAKSSLDVTLLVTGRRQAGAAVFTGASVLRVDRRGAAWELEVVHTDEKRRRCDEQLVLRSRYVILAAGTFGSTEILMRSRDGGLALSKQLGARFSANGDSMAEVYGAGTEIKAVADEGVAPKAREVGPTITTIIDRRQGNPASDVVIQDITVPAPMRRAFEELSVTANSLELLGEPDESTHSHAHPPRDHNAVDPKITNCSLLVALIGHDNADGRLVMKHPAPDDPSADGKLWVSWPELRNDPRFSERQRILESLANPPGKEGLGGRVLANPMWRALPERVTSILEAPLGPLLTVHPLGGCVMAENASHGVVDHLGRVFTGIGADVHDGLVVLDGAIVPSSLGINPALTIAALADRAIRELRDRVWSFTPASLAAVEVLPAFPRPYFREVPTDTAPLVRPTKVQVSERLLGSISLDLGSGTDSYDVELELWTEAIELTGLMACDRDRSLRIDPNKSELRIFTKDVKRDIGHPSSGDALHRMTVQGELKLLSYSDSTSLGRAFRATWAWLRNRGIRDIAQALIERPSSAAERSNGATSIFDRVRMLYALATRAGAMRRLDYELELVPSLGEPEYSLRRLKGEVRGHKTLTYNFAGNPWTQLQKVELTKFPTALIGLGRVPILSFDPTFSDRSKMALMKLVDQQDMPSALADLGSFFLYLMRTVLHVHVWTFRQPDPSPSRTPEQLPKELPGLPPPTIDFLHFDPLKDGTEVRARLTRYQPSKRSAYPPVLLIHGYSASGTTFAHDAIPEGGLAGHLCRRGHDVWVLDLRSSCGMLTSRVDWTFEQVGYADIPKAVDRILQVTGREKVDIVAHCMGSAMLAMALLGDYPASAQEDDPCLAERKLLPSRIRKLVMSQVGPAVVMAPENIFRAYLMRYIRHYLPLADYSFNTAGKPSQGDALLDRVLSSIPYPEDEFRIENPIWPPGKRTPWVATRHRMDALYGRTFKLANMPDPVLDRLNDFFGPLSLETAAQVIHFAGSYRITDAHGSARFNSPEHMIRRLDFQIRTLHSGQNGLADPLTAEAMRNYFGPPNSSWKVQDPQSGPFGAMGHQDSLIGISAPAVFRIISRFFEE